MRLDVITQGVGEDGEENRTNDTLENRTLGHFNIKRLGRGEDQQRRLRAIREVGVRGVLEAGKEAYHNQPVPILWGGQKEED